MNILQVNKFYHPTVGGIERVVQNIAEGLTGGHSTRVLATVERGVGGRRQYNGVQIRKLASLGVVLSVPIAPTFPIHLRSMAASADIVHHHLPNPLATTAHLSAVPSDQPVVATYHSDIVRQTTARRVYRPVLERFLDQVDRILVTSDRLLEHSPVLEPYREKCVVVPLSIDVSAVDAMRADGDRQVNGEEDVVLFVGRLKYYKGVDYLLEAMTDVDATLLLVGVETFSPNPVRRLIVHNLHILINLVGVFGDRNIST